jgi:hypothetical protein
MQSLWRILALRTLQLLLQSPFLIPALVADAPALAAAFAERNVAINSLNSFSSFLIKELMSCWAYRIDSARPFDEYSAVTLDFALLSNFNVGTRDLADCNDVISGSADDTADGI